MKSEDGLGKVLSDLHVLLICNQFFHSKVNKSLLQEAGNRGSTSLGDFLYVGGSASSPITNLEAVYQRSGGEKLIRCFLYALDCLQ